MQAAELWIQLFPGSQGWGQELQILTPELPQPYKMGLDKSHSSLGKA